VTDVLIYGDTERSPELRHEVPVAIGDPILYMERDGRRIVLTNVLERNRVERAVPDVELLLADELGFYDLIGEGVPRERAELEVVRRAVARAGIGRAAVPRGLPVQIADLLRADGVTLEVDGPLFDRRRRAKSAAELAGIRRAQAAAEAGLAAGAALLRAATADGDRLALEGAPLTAERVRAAVREGCARGGAPAPPDILVTSAWSGGGHDPGSGPLPARLPIEIDLWPRDEASGCWADMTRTFVVGEVPDEVARLAEIVRAALEAARSLARPGARPAPSTTPPPRSSRTPASPPCAPAHPALPSPTASTSASATAWGSRSTRRPRSGSRATRTWSRATSSRSSPASGGSKASAACATRTCSSSPATAARR
jgi:Xaa-Pro aminopeptidase